MRSRVRGQSRCVLTGMGGSVGDGDLESTRVECNGLPSQTRTAMHNGSSRGDDLESAGAL